MENISFKLEMKSIKDNEIKRRFGNNLSNNENIINLQNYRNLNKDNTKNNNINIITRKDYQNYEKEKNKISIIPFDSILNKKKYKINIFITNPNQNNSQYLEEYVQDIIKNINFTESLNILDYSTNHVFHLQDIQYINQRMRKQIIESIVYQAFLWKLNSDSIFLMVNIMDRYIHKTKIKNKEYELIGLASFFIATKYEDIYAPDAELLTKIFSYKYHYQDILDKESQILQSLDYNLLYTSSYKILNLIYHLSNINDINLKNFAHMVLELSLTDLQIMKYSQIKRAVGCFIFAKKMFGIKSGNNFIKFLFSFDESEMENIIVKLFSLLKDVVLSKEPLNLIAEKYRSTKFNSIFSAFENKLNEKIQKKNKSKEGKIILK